MLPILCQHVGHEVLKQLIKNHYPVSNVSVKEPAKYDPTYEKLSGIRYASGWVVNSAALFPISAFSFDRTVHVAYRLTHSPLARVSWQDMTYRFCSIQDLRKPLHSFVYDYHKYKL